MKKPVITSYEEAVDYVLKLPRFVPGYRLDDTRAFLKRLGSPDLSMRILHVAGTNGKGSVCAYAESVLRAAGYHTAVFTSPHLVDVRERYTIDGKMISKDDFFQAFCHVLDAVEWNLETADTDRYHPTFFEFLFLIAMLVFSKYKPDYCILETGLGGRLDATNAVADKELSVITHISLDHVEYLGDTVEKIAAEKAGIMKEGAPVVYWCTDEAVSGVLERKAAELGIKTYPVSKQHYRFLRFKNKSIDFLLSTRYYKDISLTLRSTAPYQMENAAVAVAAIEVLDGGRTITANQIRQGLENCFWAGRMEEVLPEVFVDGAHNEDGIRAFLEAVRNDGHAGSRALLFGAVSDKNYVRMVEELVDCNLFDRFFITKMRTGRAVTAEELGKVFAHHPNCKFEEYDNVAAAFHELLNSRMEAERIYIAGSLYLVGEIKELLNND